MRYTTLRLSATACGCVAAVAAFGQASGDIRVAVTHGNQTDFSLTPAWFGFHNGQFDSFNVGEAASSPLGTNSVELIAELGQTDPITADFTAAPGIPGDIQGVVAAADNGVPPIEPGETGVGYVTPINPAGYQYFSYLSMLVPTNDTFVGNDNPFAYRVFNDAGELIDANGEVTNAVTISIFGSDLLDAGTEVNDGALGPAFTQGQVGTEGADENGVVTVGSDLSSFLGNTDVTGRVINDTLLADELLATITISLVPEPTTGLLAMGAVFAGFVRRR